MLCGHSNLHVPPETWFILQLVEQFSLTAPLSPQEVAKAVHVMTSHFRWQDFDIDKNDMHNWASALERPRLRDVIDLVYRQQLKLAGKVRFGDKTPLYIGILPQLLTLYPDAKFIHLIRDGRDVSISFIDADFEGRCYDGERFEWIAAIHRGIAYRSGPIAQHILEIRYEDLVADPQNTIREICEFLSESFEPAMLKFSERLDMVPERGKQIHTKLEMPISGSAASVWKSKLSSLEIFAMEACIRKELEFLGYDLRFRSNAWKPILDTCGFFLKAAAPILDRAIPYLQRRNFLRKPIYF